MIRKGRALSRSAICETSNKRHCNRTSYAPETMNKIRFSILIFVVVALANCGRCQEVEEEQVLVKICDLCKCSNPESLDPGAEPFLKIDCIHSKNRDKVPLSSIVWPELKDDIVMSVQGFDMVSVPKLPRNEFIVSLEMKNNNIRTTWPMAFADIANLKILSLAENQMSEVTPDMFQNLKHLKQLDLSDNTLSEFNKLDFDQLKSLNTLILSGNKMKKIPVHALNNVPTLENLYMNRNEIFLLDFNDASESLVGLEKVKILDFSSNKLTVITKETFQRSRLLEYLNLSKNNIQNIDQDAFKNCNMLKTIDLSSNEIKSLAAFPPFVNTVLLSNNLLSDWSQFPESVRVLDISRNQFISTYNENDMNFDNLEILNISRNHLQSFDIVKPLPKLSVLDISFNSIETFPKSFDSNILSSIEELSIDGNPINELIFENALYLKRFSASYLERVTEIKNSNLKLKARSPSSSENDQECIDVTISHCPKLSTIESKAFNDIPLCHLDLSYNNIRTLERNQIFKSIGINLQGNPWDCSCDMQWMLDDLLVQLYDNHPMLLHELRCESPRHLNGLRFVHWYQWGERAFCSNSKKAKTSGNYMVAQSAESADSLSITTILLLVALLVAILIIGSLIAYLATGKYRQNKRIQKRKSKRQTASDAKKSTMNGENRTLTSV